MRKLILTAASCAAIMICGAAAAQGRSGGGGGGPGGGMGAGPPMTPPGQMGGGIGTSDYARDIASQRGQFGRDFAAQQRATAQQRVAEYRQSAQQRRTDALKLAQMARSGARLPASASGRIRGALKDDMEAWRDAFQVGRHDWQAMRDQWLLDRIRSRQSNGRFSGPTGSLPAMRGSATSGLGRAPAATK